MRQMAAGYRLIGLNAKTGSVITSFGASGVVARAMLGDVNGVLSSLIKQ
jgi:hypothetical protein